MITMNDIIDFVEKSMERNLPVNSIGNEITVVKDNERIGFCPIYSIDSNEIVSISIESNYEEHTLVKVENETDVLLFKLLKEKVKKYSTEHLERRFFNFLKEDDRPIDINDLDED